MSFLLDTNVLSELRKRSPQAAVRAWFESVSAEELYLSVLVLGEIRRGIERLRRRDPPQAEVFEDWLAALRAEFADRLLPVSSDIAEAWGRIGAGDPLPTIDSLLAATALVHELTFVTRDTGALAGTGVRLLDPWRAG